MNKRSLAKTDAPSPPLSLLPAQKKALDGLVRALDAQHVAVLTGRPGYGKTTVLRALHGKTGGAYLTSREFVEASLGNHPLALDETIWTVLKMALDANDAVIGTIFTSRLWWPVAHTHIRARIFWQPRSCHSA